MKFILKIVYLSAFGVLLSGCTTTENSQTQSLQVVADQATYMTADQIRETIIGNTIDGISYFKSVGNVPFKMFFEHGTRIYRDRSVVRNTVKTAFGTYRIIEDGQLCRTSKSRRQGKETCFRFGIDNGNYKLVGDDGAWSITIAPGKTF